MIARDFCAHVPERPYDRIVMNPPFERQQDVEHIERALGMLAPGGRLVAIASAGLQHRSDNKTERLRKKLLELDGSIRKLPAGSFKASGTAVETVLVIVDKAPAKKVMPAHEQPVPSSAKTRSPGSSKRPAPSRDIQHLLSKWRRHEAQRQQVDKERYWNAIPKTACWIRKEGSVSVTLCAALLDEPTGDCPPTQAMLKGNSSQLVLCQAGEGPEYFRGHTPGITAAKAEADNRIVRGRMRRFAELDAPTRPVAIDDFEAQEQLLDTLVPTRRVYLPRMPFQLLDVVLLPPQIVTPDGASVSILRWRGAIPKDAKIVMQVSASSRMDFDTFEAKLGSTLIPYRGHVAPSTAAHVLKEIPAPRRAELAARGLTMHDIQFGRIGRRSLYWLHDHEAGSPTGP
ncbi:methyltransferase [Pseudenhygromyxa sp. WMMC2535]|nr:methyltransferase [Pseudenhygromyxa sp. WMMC2535]